MVSVSASLAAELRDLVRELLRECVSPDGKRVDYQGLSHGGCWKTLEDELLRLEGVEPLAWNLDEQRAFWINLYNVLVMHGIVTQGFPRGALGQFAFFRRRAWKVGPHRMRLDDLEHGILRGNRRHPFWFFPQLAPNDPRRAWVLPLEPRIHFALNCGAVSCPPIRVYEAERLDEQLDLATASFLSGEVERKGERLELSALLRWYAADFGGRAGIARFLARYVGGTPEEYLGLRWVYRPYDWSPNAL